MHCHARRVSSGTVMVVAAVALLSTTPMSEPLRAPAMEARSDQSDPGLERYRAVREVMQAFEEAWNASDAAGLAGLFTPDGRFVSPSGTEADTRREIRRLVSREHEQAFKGTRFDGQVEAIELEDGRATVRGTYSLTGADRLGGLIEATRGGRFRCVLEARDGTWLIREALVSSQSAGLDLELP